MKVIKRNGRAVDYDRQKIAIAINKANEEVLPKEKATKEEIMEIIEYIEALGKKRMLVEDIQDIIEQKLMELNKYDLAKKYIVYRYTRALVRKQNTTDESILGIIRNEHRNLYGETSNKNSLLASAQRDYIAGEVSRDLTKRLLLPEKITKADQEGILHFHGADYFIQPIFNSCLINIGDMLDNGTAINGYMIESPKSFQVACTVLTQIIASVASNQYGGLSVDLIHLGKYLRKSYERNKKILKDKYKEKLSENLIEEIANERVMSELKSGIQTIQYQINTLPFANGQLPYITLLLHLDKDDEYIKENALIIEEVLKQRYEGIKDIKGEYKTPTFPKLIYVLDECNNLNGGEYDYLTRLAIRCTAKRNYPNYISAKKMKENYDGNIFSTMGNANFLTPYKDLNGNYKFEGRFNQGVVTINLPQVAIIADGNEEFFWQLLEERLEICKDALMYMHYALLGTLSDISPTHWQHGAIARLNEKEKIDEFLKNGYSTLSLGYIGLFEVSKIMKGLSNTTKEGKEFTLKIVKKLKEVTQRWTKETNLGFNIYATTSDEVAYKFAKIDKQKYGTIEDITDKGYYTKSFYVNVKEEIDIYDKLKFESEFQNLSNGGAISYIDIKDMKNDLLELEKLTKFIYENIQYVGFTVTKE